MPALQIEKRQRLIISVLFRILIVFYSIFLLIVAEQIYFWIYQVLVYCIYLGLYIFLHGKEKAFSYIRLLNDYLFMFFIIYQYNELDLLSYAFLLFPILNAQNHSGERKSLLVYIFPLTIIFIISKEINLFLIFPFLCFFIINSFENYRTKYIKFHENLNSVIDDFLMHDTGAYQSHKIYKDCLPLLKGKPFNFDIDDIFCFKYDARKNMFNVVNGSKFVWSFEAKVDGRGMFRALNDKNNIKSYKDISITINKKNLDKNVVFACRVNTEHFYLFVLTMNIYEILYDNIWSTQYKLLYPLFLRLAKVFEADLRQKTLESTKMLELGEKMNYVNVAVKAMHFIRNKLGPVKNYISMEDDYNNATDEKIKEKIKPFLKKERQNVESSLSLVLDRANFILEKSNNPFVVSVLNKYGIQQLFSEIRRIWGDYGLIENFDFLMEPDNFNEKQQRKYVYYNKVGMDLVLTNWISNIFKYNSGRYGLIIEEKELSYSISFFNSFKMNQLEDGDFIKQFASNDRLEIDKRKSHGLSELKEFLAQMNIQASMFIDGESVFFTIELIKRCKDEKDFDI